MSMRTLLLAAFAGLLFARPVEGQEARSQKSGGKLPAGAVLRADVSANPAADREQQLEARVKELEKKLDELTNEMEQAKIEQMVRDAESEARATVEELRPEDREYLEGGLALQKLNPEVTVWGDLLAGVVIDGTRFYASESDRSGFLLRGLGLHFQHVLDPYSSFKSALHVCPKHGIGLEEVYVSWFGLVPSLSLSVGRFRQNFGVLNRWHEHDLDQTSFPLAMRMVLGKEGLVGDGLGITWFMPPLWAHANKLTVEVVDGTNETLFSGKHFSIPAAMVRVTNYWDLSPSTYLELGLTGMFGVNNRRGWLPQEDKREDEHRLDGGSRAREDRPVAHQDKLVDEPWRRTIVAGADLTLYWSPLQQAKYRSLTWRTEFYYANKELPEDKPKDFLHAWGVYSYLQYQLSERWFVGIRGDCGLPTIRPNEDIVWDVVPYLTFWQSEFVYFRLEYQHGRNIPYSISEEKDTLAARTDNRVLLQVDFAAGPHKHEKY